MIKRSPMLCECANGRERLLSQKLNEDCQQRGVGSFSLSLSLRTFSTYHNHGNPANQVLGSLYKRFPAAG